MSDRSDFERRLQQALEQWNRELQTNGRFAVGQSSPDPELRLHRSFIDRKLRAAHQMLLRLKQASPGEWRSLRTGMMLIWRQLHSSLKDFENSARGARRSRATSKRKETTNQ